MTTPLVIESEQLVRRGNVWIGLSPIQWRILVALYEAPSHMLPTDRLAEIVGYDTNEAAHRNTFRVQLQRLRQRIDVAYPARSYVLSIATTPMFFQLVHVVRAEPAPFVGTAHETVVELIAAARAAEPHVFRLGEQRRLRTAILAADDIINQNRVPPQPVDSVPTLHQQRKRSTRPRGESVHTAKLTVADVRTIRALATSHTCRQIAARYHVTPVTIYCIISRRTWKHIE